jgi:hypothetical protein
MSAGIPLEARVAELVDAADSKSAALKSVSVRLRPRAPKLTVQYRAPALAGCFGTRCSLPPMRAVGPKRPAPPKLKLNPGPKDSHGNCFAAVAVCACGHARQLPDEWVKLATRYGSELDKVRARLKCTECGARMPRVEVYRVGG